jgi:hypothetical protein
MMARVVAELGRPETPEETAARKAESSRRYRSSKTFSGLIAAVLATLAIVAIAVLGVPRGTPAAAPPIDVSAEASALEDSLGRPVVDPALPDWRVNAARVEGEGVDAWTVVYAPADQAGFIRVAQGFDAGETWVAEVLGGAAPTGTIEIGGVGWDEYDISDSSGAGNVSYALATVGGDDRFLASGSQSADAVRMAAAALAPEILELRKDAS